jgi:hypothetical protein
MAHQTTLWPFFDKISDWRADRVLYQGICDVVFRQRLRISRTYRQKPDPLEDLTPDECRKTYRFYPHVIDELSSWCLANNLGGTTTKRSNSLSVQTRLCAALLYFASGNFFRCPLCITKLILSFYILFSV